MIVPSLLFFMVMIMMPQDPVTTAENVQEKNVTSLSDAAPRESFTPDSETWFSTHDLGETLSFVPVSEELSSDVLSDEGVIELTPTQENAITDWHEAKASWYGPGFYGEKTADGTIYTDSIILVAHRTLPLGSKVAIKYKGRTIVAPVKDRGPYMKDREFDLSNKLAEELDFSGVQTIRWAIVP